MKTIQVVKDDIIELMNIMYKVINRKKKKNTIKFILVCVLDMIKTRSLKLEIRELCEVLFL